MFPKSWSKRVTGGDRKKQTGESGRRGNCLCKILVAFGKHTSTDMHKNMQFFFASDDEAAGFIEERQYYSFQKQQ